MLGDGKDISVWRDPWLGDCPNFKPAPRDQNPIVEDLQVADLIAPSFGRWDEQRIQNLFTRHSADQILKLKIPTEERKDELIWALENKGNFSVKSMHKELARRRTSTTNPLKQQLGEICGSSKCMSI